MRRLFTTQEATARGLTPSQLRWGEATGRWRRVHKSVYGEGPEEPTELDRRVAEVLARGAVVSGRLAGVLHGLDGVRSPPAPDLPGGGRWRPSGSSWSKAFAAPTACRRWSTWPADLDDLVWEQALESALRRRLVTVGELESVAARAGPGSHPRHGEDPAGAGPASARSAAHREPAGDADGPAGPHGAGPARAGAADGGRIRQGRPRLAGLGLFVELDGQQHKDQPLYDARRETAVVAATGWLCGRFTWTEVVRFPTSTARRLAPLADQARRRPPRPFDVTIAS